MTNDDFYKNILRDLLHSKYESDNGCEHERLGFGAIFDGLQPLTCINEEYVKAELAWYQSMNCDINSNPRIAKNSIWRRIASDTGRVNSNYGWCLYSPENKSQYKHALEAITNDLFTKHCVMIYSRPSINSEWNDNIHAKSDMICTIYTSVNVRYKAGAYCLVYDVHMRSCDAWYGLRNDFMWHHKVLMDMKAEIEKTHRIKIERCDIVWFADSLHLYDWELDTVKKFLEA